MNAQPYSLLISATVNFWQASCSNIEAFGLLQLSV